MRTVKTRSVTGSFTVSDVIYLLLAAAAVSQVMTCSDVVCHEDDFIRHRSDARTHYVFLLTPSVCLSVRLSVCCFFVLFISE